MAFSAEISRDNPTCFLFVIDQSGSMSEKMPTGRPKSEFVADVLNKTIYTLVTNCSKSDGVRNYFDIGVIGYGDNGTGAGLGGSLAGSIVHPITSLANAPLRIEDRTKLDDDGAGGVIERRVKFPVWFLPTASGGTPMRSALTRAAEVLVDWCDGHPTNYPPTVIHVTDGESTDGNPADIAEAIAQISTTDGACLLFNLHVSSQPGQEIRFPSTNGQLPDDYARLLYQMSSTMPGHVVQQAAARGYQVSDASRGFMFNADPKDIANFFDIGTRPRLTAER